MKGLLKIFCIIVFQFFILFVPYPAFSQSLCLNPVTNHCFSTTPPGTSEFIQEPSPNNVDFEFDNMSQYVAGITYSGATTLKLKIDEQSATCRWKLMMYIVNNGGAGNEWHGTPYNPLAGGNMPLVSLLQVKVYNSCRTSPINAIYQTFVTPGTGIDIIDNAGYVHSAGVCNGS